MAKIDLRYFTKEELIRCIETNLFPFIQEKNLIENMAISRAREISSKTKVLVKKINKLGEEIIKIRKSLKEKKTSTAKDKLSYVKNIEKLEYNYNLLGKKYDNYNKELDKIYNFLN